MAQQLVYTSASKLLDAGRSGFGTVARSKSLSPLLVSAIERVSQFANIRGTDRTRVIFVHRRITAANNRVHLLSRIADAGADYTGRTNHIAHHLIVTQEEMTRAAAQGITPADVLMQFPWLERWDGAARFFGPEEDVSLIQIIQPRGLHSSRATWAHTTGNPSHARLLSWDGAPRNGVLIVPRGVDPLGILAEALAEFGTQSWSRTFTTSLESTDEMSDLDWVISSPDTFHEIEGRCAARTRFDLAIPQSLPVPPEPVKAVEAPASPQPASYPQPFIRPTTQPVAEPAFRVEPMAMNMGGGAGAAMRAPLKVVAVKKNHSKAYGIAAAGVLLIVATAIFFKVAKESSSTAPNIAITNVPDQAKIEEAAIKKLTDKKVPDELAKEFVKKINSDLEKWTNYACDLIELFNNPKYACDLIELFNNPKDPTKIGNLPVRPNGKISSVKWLSELENANKKLHEYYNFDIKCKDNHFDYTNDRMKYISEIYNYLKNANKTKILAENSADKFCGPLIKYALNERLKNKKNNDDKKLIKDYFNPKKNQSAYDELQILIKENFETLITSSLVNGISESDAEDLGIPEDDIVPLRLALFTWNRPNENINEKLKDNIGKGFIPADFEELLKNHRSKNQGTSPDNTKETPLTNETVKEQEKPSGPDLKDVKEKEIIIVSADDLKKGVPVTIIEKIFEKHFADKTEKVEIAELTIKFNPSDSDNENTRWFLSDDKNFYRRSKVKGLGMLDLGKNGNVIYDKADINHMVITYTQNKKEYICYIVIDDKSKDLLPFIPNDISFELKHLSDDEVEIIGDLQKLIHSLYNYSENIEIYYNNIIRPHNINFDELKIQRQKNPTASKSKILISNDSLVDIDQKFESYKDNSQVETSNQKEIDTKNKDKNTAINKLKQSMYLSLEEAALLEYLNIDKIDKIDEKKHMNKVREASKLSEGVKWDGALKDAKKLLGEDKFKSLYKNDRVDKWDENTGKKIIEDFVNKFKSAHSATDDSPNTLSPSLSKEITSITVKTKSGNRVLFTAKKQL